MGYATIPAWAGETLRRKPEPRDHPRVGGGDYRHSAAELPLGSPL